MKVSYIVAAYNVASTIERCLRSLFEQTYDNIEYILVDDASTDGTLAIMQRVLADYPRRQPQVRFVLHEHNLGLVATRWDGFQASTGDYILFFDGDDYAAKEMMERMTETAVQRNADIVVCDYWYQRFNGRLSYCQDLIPLSQSVDPRQESLNRKQVITVWRRLIRRSLLVVTGGCLKLRNFQ